MDGKPVIVPIHLNAQGAIDVQNEVASAFGADYIRRIIGDNGENLLKLIRDFIAKTGTEKNYLNARYAELEAAYSEAIKSGLE